ncbi:meiotic recombination protein REC114 isoform X2 [Heterocephalus glaber]|uniref:Meiotic recombination protein REC114 isoform X2 n=1 Tax=Heterocephalus glaber TaxID=10181 RepID=A0AAX6R8L8_HETGA|nr:meiotic recombination protein REC114 isoform X2 [Heterocephalus glaber]
MAEAGKVPASLGVPGGDAVQWPLQRYGRFMLSEARELSESGPKAGAVPSPTWKVFDSSEESGYLVLTIVISGHFFISQGQTLLEGFSLIGSKNWLKIVRRMDCLLFGATIKNKSRMFRIQFGGESKEQALEHCCSCVQSLARYTTVEVPDSITRLSPGLLWAGDHQGRDCAKSIPLQPGSILASEELPLAYEQSAWSVEELGPFLRLCLMDQNFPAFVEKVENELKKLTEMRN